MLIGVPSETLQGEDRVALTPEAAAAPLDAHARLEQRAATGVSAGDFRGPIQGWRGSTDCCLGWGEDLITT